MSIFLSRSLMAFAHRRNSIHCMLAVAVGVCYYFLAHWAVHGQGGVTLAAIAWPAPALAIALLWPRPIREWSIFLLAIFIAAFLANRVDGLSLSAQLAFALLNMIEVALCAWLGQRYVAPDGWLTTIKQLTWFLLLLPFGAIAVIAALGATISIWIPNSATWFTEWRFFAVGNGVAILVLTPALLNWRVSSRHPWTRHRLQVDGVLIAGGAIIAALILVCAELHAPAAFLRVLFSLVLVLAAIYGGMASASLVLAVAAVLMVALVLLGIGPYERGGAMSIWFLQLDIAGYAILAFFVAVVVNERKTLFMRLEQAKRFESLGLLAGGIAHDFNNVLGAIAGYGEMVDERLPANSSARQPLHTLLAAVKRGATLVEQILLNPSDRVLQKVDLRDITRETVTLAKLRCPEGVTIALHMPDEPLPIHANVPQMTRALLNLVMNAAQAARATVIVTAGQGGERNAMLAVGRTPTAAFVWVEVADDGQGIASEHMDLLFEPFFSTRRAQQGTGLGLTVVASIAIEHEGGVDVHSDHSGAQFRFVLPLANPVLLGHGEYAVLVSDDCALRERMEEWFAELGFEPVSYGEPQNALLKMKAEASHLALLVIDIADDSDLLTRIRESLPSLPVIVCSENPRIHAITGAVKLSKPFNRLELAQAVVSAIGRKS